MSHDGAHRARHRGRVTPEAEQSAPAEPDAMDALVEAMIPRVTGLLQDRIRQAVDDTFTKQVERHVADHVARTLKGQP